jgi:hypothetical protein
LKLPAVIRALALFNILIKKTSSLVSKPRFLGIVFHAQIEFVKRMPILYHSQKLPDLNGQNHQVLFLAIEFHGTPLEEEFKYQISYILATPNLSYLPLEDYKLYALEFNPSVVMDISPIVL